MKKCNKCNTDKELNEFHICKSNKDGFYNICKLCKKEYDKKYRESEKITKLYKSKKYRDRKSEYRRFISKTKPERMIFIAAKARAKKYNIPFNITIDDIVIPEKCPILEIPLYRKEYGKGGSFQPNSPSLDKINPKLGYIKGNIMVISMKANAMKYNASEEELLLFSKNIIKYLNKC